MWDKIKNIFKKKEEPQANPVVQLQVFSNGSWKNIKNKKVEEGKQPPRYRHVITLHDGRVEIVDVV
jgi:hypothetical protein